MGKGGKEYEARMAITDEAGVLIPSGSATKLYSSISEIFVADLLSEGEIEGIVSGQYFFEGELGATGYKSERYQPYFSVNAEGENDASLGFLKSVYWNEVPVVDEEGYYNYPEINLKETKGLPQGETPSLNTSLGDTLDGQAGEQDMQIALFRSIGDRLFGPPIEVGSKAPAYYKSNNSFYPKNQASKWYKYYAYDDSKTINLDQGNSGGLIIGVAGFGTEEKSTIIGQPLDIGGTIESSNTRGSFTSDQNPVLKGDDITRNAKTYKISNKECYAVAVSIKVPVLAEQIKDDTTDGISNDPKKFASQEKGTSSRGRQLPYGAGDLRARKIRYQVHFRPVFDNKHSKASFFSGGEVGDLKSYASTVFKEWETLQYLKEGEAERVENKLDNVISTSESETITIQMSEDSDIANQFKQIAEKTAVNKYISGNAIEIKNADELREVATALGQALADGSTSFPWMFGYDDEIFGRFDAPYLRSRTLNLESYGIDVWSKEAENDYELFQGWEIKIARTTPDSVHTFLRNQSFVDSIVEIYKPKMRYPYCAMVYSKFGADNFSNAPARSYDARLIKVKIPNNYDPIRKTYGISNILKKNETTGQFEPTDEAISSFGLEKQDDKLTDETLDNFYEETLKGSKLSYVNKTTKKTEFIEFTNKENDLTNIDADYISAVNIQGETTEHEFWNGEFNTEKAWTDNPAWCFYDLMTNYRYGLGEYIKKESVDKWTLYDISKYSDVLVYDSKGNLEPRFTFNNILVSRDEAYKVLNDMASAFRSMLYYAFGQIYIAQDKPRDPVYHFNNSNVLNGKFSYSSSSRKARHTVALVRYIDKYNSYKPAISYTEDSEAIRRYGIREVETAAIGCTSESQAKRFGDWMLKSEALETETVSFTAGIEGSYLRPGDVFSIYDRYRNSAGMYGRTNHIKVEDKKITNIILDRPITLKKDIDYKISILVPTFNYQSNEERVITGLNSRDSSDIRRSHLIEGVFSAETENPQNEIILEGDQRINSEGYEIKPYNKYVFSIEPVITDEEINYISPDEENDHISLEAIKGQLEYFRVVNIKEDKHHYEINALQYSYSKYDEPKPANENSIYCGLKE